MTLIDACSFNARMLAGHWGMASPRVLPCWLSPAVRVGGWCANKALLPTVRLV